MNPLPKEIMDMIEADAEKVWPYRREYQKIYIAAALHYSQQIEELKKELEIKVEWARANGETAIKRAAEVDEKNSEIEQLKAENERLKALFNKSLLSFGNHRNYWCVHCSCHVTNGHKENCIMVTGSIELFGRDWTENNIQVEEWNNYGYIAFGSKLNTNLK